MKKIYLINKEKETIKKLYLTEGFSISKIATILHIKTRAIIKQYLIQENINIRNKSQARIFNKKIPSRETLFGKYITNENSIARIARDTKLSTTYIKKLFLKYNIKIRSVSESQRIIQIGKKNSCYRHGKYAQDNKSCCIDCGKEIHAMTELKGNGRCVRCSKIGSLSSQWQNGKTKLHKLIRNLLENGQWRTEVFKRDDYTCQECYKRGEKLEAHHKKEFHIIFAEFLKEYDQFSPIEDKETLLRLAMKYKPFWNIDNGQTLCKDCHNLTKKRK